VLAFVNEKYFSCLTRSYLADSTLQTLFHSVPHRRLPIRSLKAGNVRYRLKVWKKNERGSGYFI